LTNDQIRDIILNNTDGGIGYAEKRRYTYKRSFYTDRYR
jgi:hypothetical protein